MSSEKYNGRDWDGEIREIEAHFEDPVDSDDQIGPDQSQIIDTTAKAMSITTPNDLETSTRRIRGLALGVGVTIAVLGGTGALYSYASVQHEVGPPITYTFESGTSNGANICRLIGKMATEYNLPPQRSNTSCIRIGSLAADMAAQRHGGSYPHPGDTVKITFTQGELDKILGGTWNVKVANP